MDPYILCEEFSTKFRIKKRLKETSPSKCLPRAFLSNCLIIVLLFHNLVSSGKLGLRLNSRENSDHCIKCSITSNLTRLDLTNCKQVSFPTFTSCSVFLKAAVIHFRLSGSFSVQQYLPYSNAPNTPSTLSHNAVEHLISEEWCNIELIRRI